MPKMPQLGARRTPQSGRAIASVDLSAEGRAIEGFGNTALNIADDMAKKQKQEEEATAVFAARRAMDDWERENIYDPEKGAITKLGQDSFELPKTIPKSFDDFTSKLTQSVSSPRAKQALEEMILSRRKQTLGFVDRHTLQQKNVYEEGQFKADVDSSLNRSAMLVDAGDFATASAEVKTIQSRLVGRYKALGRSEEETAMAVRELQSQAAVTTINVLLEKDKPIDAEKFLNQHAGSMKVEDMLRAQSAVGKAMDAQQAVVVATEVVEAKMRPAVEPTDFGRLMNLAGDLDPKLVDAVKQAESGGKRYGADGKLLTSPKGAKGEMQVMDATNRDPGYGVKPAKDNSPDERARVGRDYLAAMVREFKGDVPQALAAYNAGPGAVEKAVKEGGANWLAKLPAETQAYVAKITKAYGDGGGVPTMPTLASLHAEVRAMIPTSQPQRLKMTLDAVTQRYETNLKAKKQQEDQALARGYEWLDQNAGRFSQMPASIRSTIPAKEFDNLMNYGQRVARGDDITDPIVFQKMATDDAWLKGMTDAEFYTHSRKLSQADQQQMALRRGKLLNGDEGQKGPGTLDTAGVNSILNNRLQQIGIDPTPKDGNPAMRVGAIRKHVWDSVIQAQQAAGKKFNDAEMTSHIDKLFAQNVTFQTTFLGMKTGTESQRLLSMEADDIPSETRKRLKEDFKAQGITDPTDADILGAYFQLKAARQ